MNGPLALLRLDPEQSLDVAHRLVASRRLRTLDALHLAVGLTDAVELAAGQGVTLVTTDADPQQAARASGLEIL